MSIWSDLDKDNLHHAYLIEGREAELREEIIQFLSDIQNRELVEINTDTFKIEDARNLKSLGAEKSFSADLPAGAGKRFFLISANSILREAQNALLKLFEEPIPDTHFFLMVPDANALLKTLLSRFYILRSARKSGAGLADKFIAMRPAQRIDFIKGLIEEEEESETLTDSARARSLQFINALEGSLHGRAPKNLESAAVFEHIFKVREILRMPGSSVKNLLESVALVAPVIQ